MKRFRRKRVKISKKRQKEIETLIEQEIFSPLGMPPDLNIVDVVKAFDIDVGIVDFEKNSEFKDKGVSGLIHYPQEDEERVTILIDKNQSKQRRTFTVAHELAHFMLHHKPNLGNRFRLDFETYRGDVERVKEELEADYFAGVLLVPKEAIFAAIGTPNYVVALRNIPELAEYFGVSRSMMTVRLKWLMKNLS